VIVDNINIKLKLKVLKRKMKIIIIDYRQSDKHIIICDTIIIND